MADSKRILIKIDVTEKNASANIKKTKKAVDDLATSTERLAVATNKSKTNTGLNNAIIAETARLASDASYGFTGMANNLGQLVNLFKASKDAGQGYSGALYNLIGVQSLVLIGTQLLIAFGDDIYDWFIRATKGSRILQEAFKDAASTVESTAGNYKVYTEVLRDSTKTEEQHALATKKLNEEFPEYIQSLKDAGVSLEDVKNNTEEAIRVNDLYEQSLLRLAKSRAAMNKIEELYSDILQNEIDAQLKLQDLGITEDEAREAQTKQTERFVEAKEEESAMARAYARKASVEYINAKDREAIAILKTLDANRESAEKNIDILTKYIQLTDKKIPKFLKSRNRAFRMADLDFEKERQQSNERILKSSVKSEKGQIIIQMQGIKDRARIKTQEFKEDQKRRLDQFLASSATEEQKLDARRKYNEEVRNAEQELASYLIVLSKETDKKINDLTLEQTQQQLGRLREQAYKEQELKQQAADQEILNEGVKAGNLLEVRNNQLAAEEERIRLSLENDNLTFKQREALEKEYTQVTNEQTKLRIEDAEREALSKRQLTEQVGNALTAFSSLAGKEKEAGKKLAIAGTLISTYSAAQKAFESQFLPAPTLNSPIRGALAAAAAIASGLANVRAIQSEGKSAPSKAAPTVEAPDFNVVGASPESQLAQTVAGQQSKPLKAFVVGKEITSQQELDRNIVTNAALGD